MARQARTVGRVWFQHEDTGRHKYVDVDLPSDPDAPWVDVVDQAVEAAYQLLGEDWEKWEQTEETLDQLEV